MKDTTLSLWLYHGRHDPGQEMDEWGFNASPINGVTGLTVTYCSTYRVHFVGKAACDIARKITGWESWDAATLEMRMHEDLVVTIPEDDDEDVSYFGDWHLG